MGCLKLSYYQTYSNRKVLYSDCVLEPKSAQMWLSVDPMSDKYPSMSPYNYCANNPVILVDPDGRDVEFSTFNDFLNVAKAALVDRTFRRQLVHLIFAKDNYIFKGYNGEGSGDAGYSQYDGEKGILICYNFSKNENEGTNFITNLRHETQHAVQFSKGHVRYINKFNPAVGTNNWVIDNYDINDEIDARNQQYRTGFFTKISDNSSRQKWWRMSYENRRTVINMVYPELSNHQGNENNSNETIKDNNVFQNSYRP